MRYLLALFMALPACTSKEKQFKSELASGRCDQALLNLPERDPMVKLADKSEQAAGTVLSYAFVGASYTAEVLLDAAGGTVMFVALCGVPLVLTAALHVTSNGHGSAANGGAFIGCFPGKMNALASPPLGRQAVKSTRDMRCPDLKSLSRSVRAVAACYEEQGGEENLKKAKANLAALKSSEDFFACLPAEEKEIVRKQEQALDLKLVQ